MPHCQGPMFVPPCGCVASVMWDKIELETWPGRCGNQDPKQGLCPPPLDLSRSYAECFLIEGDDSKSSFILGKFVRVSITSG